MSTGTIRILIVLAVLAVFAVLVTGVAAKNKKQTSAAVSGTEVIAAPAGSWRVFEKPSDEALRARLDDLQYRVTRLDGTEPAFQNIYWDNHEAGIYVDVVSGEPLFSSLDKFDSGTGWPSFTSPLVSENVAEVRQRSMLMSGVEVRSHYADSHLGHVFEDGPDPTGLRYCINSAALRFVPVDRMEASGYGEFLPLFGKTPKATGPTQVATIAGGCFWGMEGLIRDIPGVVDTEVGYTGGSLPEAGYEDVHTGKTGHAEAIRVVFDPERLSYEELLGFFFRIHDPTTPNRQGNDVGSQYRSAIFYHDEAQRASAEKVKESVNRSGKWKQPVVTEIAAAGPFYVAEDYHQDYLEKHPNGYTCHFLRD